jgi:hypothetical protein
MKRRSDLEKVDLYCLIKDLTKTIEDLIKIMNGEHWSINDKGRIPTYEELNIDRSGIGDFLKVFDEYQSLVSDLLEMKSKVIYKYGKEYSNLKNEKGEIINPYLNEDLERFLREDKERNEVK